MSDQYPRLRSDLVVRRHETPEGPSFVLKDPGSRRFFRLREAEYSVARRLDGATPIPQVAEQVAAELGVEAEPDVISAFVEQLRHGGLLEGAQAAVPPPRKFLQGDLLWLRLTAFDPDRLLDRLIGRVRFCFTPRFLAAAAALIVWALVTVLTRSAEIQSDLVRLWSLEILAVAWLTVIAVTTVHEFAHGLTCKHFGGHVHEMGFLLIYFQPAFYCNISDAWLFPEKSRRLWVTFAGAFVELLVWALATLLWAIAEPGTWAHSAALIVMATSGIKLFFNLNPLIKLDGYYLLSDWLEIPNLRQRAFAHVGAALRRLAGFAGGAGTPDATPRERRVFLTYGLVAMAFSYWLLSSVLFQFGGWLTERWKGWGAVGWSALFLGVAGNVTGRRVLRWPAALSLKSHRFRLFAVAMAALVLLRLVPLELRVGGEMQVAPARNTDVRAQVEGIIDAVFVGEGDQVVAGDTLARLSDVDTRARLRMVAADLAERNARLALLEAGPRAEEVEVARLAVARIDEKLRYSRAELERIRGLGATEVVSRKEVEVAEQATAVLANELDGERARLRMLMAGSRPEEMAAVREEIARSDAELRHLESQIARAWVVAPHGGVVATPKPREKVGEHVEPGDLIAEVYAVETVTAEVAIPEQDVGEVRVDQRGSVRLRAFPDQALEGRVIAVAPAAVDVPGQRGRVVRATIELPNAGGRVKPSMTGYARIHCGRRSALDVLSRPLRRFFRLELWSWW